MLSREALEHYRQMTPGQRLNLSIQMTREAWPYLFVGPPEVVNRRFERIRQENDARNRAMLQKLSESQTHQPPTSLTDHE